MIGDYKEVFFDAYCPTCKHKDEPEVIYDDKGKTVSDRCNECLTIPARIDSHKPELWEESTENS